MIGVYAPHLGEELWEKLGYKQSVSQVPWPQYDERLTVEQEVRVVVQVNGKVRDKFTVPAGTATDALEQQAQNLPGIRKWTDGHTIIKIISVPNKLVNIVIV
jgi:leucyl-tRNA synthetase